MLAHRLGSPDKALRLLAEARAQNPHVPDYLLGRKALPDPLPDVIRMGGEDEGQSCAAISWGAWHLSPGALAWLEAGS